MEKAIYVANLNDTLSIVDAFQRATDRVFNADAVRRLLGGSGSRTIREQVYDPSGISSLGMVSVVLGGGREERGSSLLLSVYAKGHNAAPLAQYVSPHVAKLFVVRLYGTRLSATAKYDPHYCKYRVHLRTSTVMLRTHPRAMVSVGMVRP